MQLQAHLGETQLAVLQFHLGPLGQRSKPHLSIFVQVYEAGVSNSYSLSPAGTTNSGSQNLSIMVELNPIRAFCLGPIGSRGMRDIGL